ncbi:MAG: HAD hydrolase family protein, partial [Solobacterium sp.]|nr:HAD hydrolase family protein [Solobacterium sp.]
MIKELKAVCADVDGTLCLKGGQLNPMTRQAIEDLHTHGILFGLGTGRAINQRVFTMKEFWGLSFMFDFIIGMNGGQLWTSDEPTVKNQYLLSRESMKEII